MTSETGCTASGIEAVASSLQSGHGRLARLIPRWDGSQLVCCSLPPSPPAEKATAREDQAGETSIGDGTGYGRGRDIERAVGIARIRKADDENPSHCCWCRSTRRRPGRWRSCCSGSAPDPRPRRNWHRHSRPDRRCGRAGKGCMSRVRFPSPAPMLKTNQTVGFASGFPAYDVGEDEGGGNIRGSFENADRCPLPALLRPDG
jgi:hypothetical protein